MLRNIAVLLAVSFGLVFACGKSTDKSDPDSNKAKPAQATALPVLQYYSLPG